MAVSVVLGLQFVASVDATPSADMAAIQYLNPGFTLREPASSSNDYRRIPWTNF
jgi:hypothetical protein